MPTDPPRLHDGLVTRVLLLPSPLLPWAVHEPFIRALDESLGASRGGAATVDVATFPCPPRDADAVLGAFRRRVEEVTPDLVLTHSNGGRYPALAAPGVPVVHVDAALPPESGDPSPMAPGAMLDRLAEMADDAGLLPPWSQWWPEEDLAAVLPDPGARRALREREHRVPLAYFRSQLGAPTGWTAGPQAYLAFGDTYAHELGLAHRRGWPTERLEGAGHLHHLVEPSVVADAVLGLATRIRGAGPGGG